MKRKLFAILMALTLVLTYLPAVAFADGEGEGEGEGWTLKRPTSDTGDIFFFTDDCPADLYAWVDYENMDDTDIFYRWYLVTDSGEELLDEGYFTNEIHCNASEEGTYRCEATLDEDTQSVEFDVQRDSDVYVDDEFGDLPDAGTINEIQLNKLVNVSVTETSPIVTFKFTPADSGFFVFESYGEGDPYGQVRTDNELIRRVDDTEGEEGLNFRVEFYGDAGVTYYLQAKDISNERRSFQVKLYDVPWLSYAVDNYQTFEGAPVTMKVEFEADVRPANVTFTWYDYSNQLIKDNGTDTLKVSEGKRYYCLVSDGKRSQKVFFTVDLADVVENNVRLIFEPGGNYANVRAYWPDEESPCATKGNVTIPANVTFADGKTREVKCIDYFGDAVGLTSVSIPSTVESIWNDAFVNTGLKSVEIPATVERIDEYAFGYTRTYDEAKDDYNYTLVPGFVIYGKTGSAAQKYATENNIKFVDKEAEAAEAKAKAEAEAKAKAAAAAKAAEEARQGTLDSSIPKVKASKPATKKATVTAKWKKLKKKQLKNSKVTHYEVWICENTGFAKEQTIEKIVKKNKASVKFTGLKKNTKYYVKVRGIKYVNGVKHVGAWSQKTIKTKKK